LLRHAFGGPAIGEFLPDYEATLWTGLDARKHSAEIVNLLNREINAALADPKIRARFAEVGAIPLPGSPGGFGKFIVDEIERWTKLVCAANVRPQ
jgi:tripartite-type tricarboxylate transporter receptor subunit TctC